MPIRRNIALAAAVPLLPLALAACSSHGQTVGGSPFGAVPVRATSPGAVPSASTASTASAATPPASNASGASGATPGAAGAAGTGAGSTAPGGDSGSSDSASDPTDGSDSGDATSPGDGDSSSSAAAPSGPDGAFCTSFSTFTQDLLDNDDTQPAMDKMNKDLQQMKQSAPAAIGPDVQTVATAVTQLEGGNTSALGPTYQTASDNLTTWAAAHCGSQQ